MSHAQADAAPIAPVFLAALRDAWWLVLLRGIAAIAFGVLAFVWPGLSLLTLIFLYGAYAILDGVFAFAAAWRGGGFAPRWWLALVGIVSLAAGVVAFAWPGVTAFVLVVVIGAWSIVRGVFELIGAWTLRKEIKNEWLLALGGLLSIGVGVLLLAQPGAGALALVWVIGAYAIVLGVVLSALALRLRAAWPARKAKAGG